MEFDVKQASNMPMVELLPELVDRTKRLINCDRASIFMLSEDRSELTTILAQNTQQISIPADTNSIAGVVRSRPPRARAPPLLLRLPVRAPPPRRSPRAVLGAQPTPRARAGHRW